MSIENALKAEFANEIEKLKKENQEVHEAVIRKHKELMEIRMSMITEECPHCSNENTVWWDVSKSGHEIFCPKCGCSMLLCGECLVDSDFCDWDEATTLCYRVVERLWRDFEDILFVEDANNELVLEKEFRIVVKSGEGSKELACFSAGTNREDIWRWFDQRHYLGVGYLLNGPEKAGEEEENR